MEGYEKDYEQLLREYEILKQNLDAYEKGIQQAYLDPETREPLKKILSKHAGVVVDDPPYEKAVKEEINMLKGKIEEIEKEKTIQSKKQQENALKSLMQSYGITEGDIPELKSFIAKTGITPTTLEGWQVVLQNFQRSKIASPTYTPPIKEYMSKEDYIKNPKEAFFKAHLEALKTK